MASAKFASAEPKLRLLLRAGYLFSLHAAPRFKANQEKDICFLSVSPDGTHHARRGRPKQELLPIGVCEFLSLAHAKAEDVKLREKMSRARAPRPFRVIGEAPEGTAGFTFLVTSLLNDKEVTSKPAQRTREAV